MIQYGEPELWVGTENPHGAVGVSIDAATDSAVFWHPVEAENVKVEIDIQEVDE